MRTLRRRLNPDAVFQAAVKGNDKNHQRKFMSRTEKWAADIREALHNNTTFDPNSSGGVSAGF